MGDHYDELIFGDVLEYLHYLHARLGVKRAGRLVGKQNVGIVDEGAGYCDALHLAARHLVRLFVKLVAEPDHFKRFGRSAAALRAVYARKRQRKLDV